MKKPPIIYVPKSFRERHSEEYVNSVLNQSMQDYNLNFEVMSQSYVLFNFFINSNVNGNFYPYTFKGVGNCLVDFIHALKSMGLNYNANRFLIDECEDYDNKPFFKRYQDCFSMYPRLCMLQFPLRYHEDQSVFETKKLPRMFDFGLQPGPTFRDQCKRLYHNAINLCEKEKAMGSDYTEKAMQTIIETIKRFFNYVFDVKEYLDKESNLFENIADKYDFTKDNAIYALDMLRFCTHIPWENTITFETDVLKSYIKAYNLTCTTEKEISERTRLSVFHDHMVEKLQESYFAEWNNFRKEIETDWAKSPDYYKQELVKNNRAGLEFPADPKLIAEDSFVLKAIANAGVKIWQIWSNHFPRTTGHCLVDIKKGRFADGSTTNDPILKSLLEGQYYTFMKRFTLEQLKYESKFYQSTAFFEALMSGCCQSDYIKKWGIDPLKYIYSVDVVSTNALYEKSSGDTFNSPNSSIYNMVPYCDSDFKETLRFLHPDYYEMIMKQIKEMERNQETP